MKNKIKFLTYKNFEQFINGLKLSNEQKNALISDIPNMDNEGRADLFNTLKNIYSLDLEEAEAVERIQKNWEVD